MALAYVEIWKGGKLITRRRVDERKARQGCRIRLGSAGEVHISLGQSKTLGKFEVRMLEGDLPTGPPEHDQNDPMPQREHRSPKLLDFSVGAPGFGAERTDRPPDIEGYKIIERLGEGGMGTVWRAEQLSTRRQVALKIMSSSRFSSGKAQARFEREVELTARLDHPNIASLFDSGLHHGMNYYAMELIDGIPLNQYIKSRHLSKNQILALMQKICQAVLYAHLRAVIHRDLKPSNILVSEDGQPHVLDFGLAKALLDEDEALTISIEGQIAGTPAYMSPEQAAGHQNETDTRTDVFSLGVILYELLVGQSPHDRSGSMFDLLNQITEGKIRRPREVNKSIDIELEAILLKALARNPNDRYASAGTLAKDITNYLDEEPLDAQVQTTFYFLRKKVRKYRRQALTAVILITVSVCLGLYGFGKWVEQTTRVRELEIEARKGTLVDEHLKWTELELKILSDDKDEARASLRVMRDRFLRTQERFQDLAKDKLKLPRRVRHIDLEKGNPLKLKSLVRGPALPRDVNSWSLETIPHRGPVHRLLSHPDGQTLVSAGEDCTLRVWDMNAMDLEAVFIKGPHLRDVAWTSDGRSLVGGHYNGYATIRTWDRQMRENTRTVTLETQDTHFMRLSPLAKYVASYWDDANAVQIWDVEKEQQLYTFENYKSKPLDMAWSDQGRYLAVLESNEATVWDVFDNVKIDTRIDPNAPVSALAWLPKSNQLSLVYDNRIDLLNIPAGALAETIRLPINTPVDDVAWSPAGRTFSLLSERKVCIVDRINSAFHKLHVPNVMVQAWVGRYLAISNIQGSIYCVDPAEARIAHHWISQWCGPACQVRIAPSGDRVALLAANGMISLWDMFTWEPIAHEGAQNVNLDDFVYGSVLLWSPAGDELACSDSSGTALVFRDSHSLQKTRILSVPDSRITCAERSEKELLAVGTEKGDLYIYHWSETEPLSRLTAHYGPVTAVAWPKPDQQVISAGQDQTIRFWDLRTGQCTKTLTGHEASVCDMVLSADHKQLASIDPNRNVLIWDVSSGTQIQRPSDYMIRSPKEQGELTVAAWSPDGTMLAVAGQKGEIQVCKLQDQRAQLRRFYHTCHTRINCLTWSPDNRYLLAGGDDGPLRVLDVQNDIKRVMLIQPLSGPAGPGIAITDEGDYRGPPGIDRYLRYVVNCEGGFQTWRANEFYTAFGWVNEPWQVGLFQPGKEEIQRLYVRADAQGPFDGLTWNTAFKDLQNALSRAAQGTEIWVARGTYRPDRGTGSREASFVLPEGIRVFGGFTGNESRVHQRDPEHNVTILSGDLLGNDRGLVNNDENSFHVVVIERPRKKEVPQGALLDGFTVRGGNASETRDDTREQQRNQVGGGVLVEGDRVTVQNCVFEHNAAFNAGGLNLVGHENTVEDCRFINNVSLKEAGGLFLGGDASRVSRCVFESNRSELGGGLVLGGRGSLVADCQFIMNQARNGGGVFGGQDDSIALLFCSFDRNRAEHHGGAWDQRYTRAVKAQNCLFVNNIAGTSGGAFYSHGYRGRVYLEGCGFIGNSAVHSGGTLSYQDSKIKAVNCSFVYNRISGDPRDKGIVGGIYHDVRDPNNDTALVLSNCILWGNTDHRHHGEQAQLQALHLQINNCCIQGWTGRLGGINNHGDDPLFMNVPGPDGVLGTPDDDLRLGLRSPCIDRGDMESMGMDEVDMDHDGDVNEPIPLDLRQQSRVLGPTVDIGTCEAQ